MTNVFLPCSPDRHESSQCSGVQCPGPGVGFDANIDYSVNLINNKRDSHDSNNESF